MKNKYFKIAIIGFIIWAIETAAFGFNAKPQSGLEGFLDTIAIILMIYGILGDIATNLHIHKHYKSITNIKTDNVEFKDKANIASYKVGMKNSDPKKD